MRVESLLIYNSNFITQTHYDQVSWRQNIGCLLNFIKQNSFITMMLILLLNLLLSYAIVADNAYPKYQQTISLANDLYDAIGMSGNGKIVAKIVQLDHSEKKFILKVQQISHSTIIGTFQMEIPVIPKGHFMWHMSLSQDGKRIAAHSYYTRNILIFQRVGQSAKLQYIHANEKMLTTDFNIMSFCMSNDGQMITLGNFSDFIQIYIYNKTQFVLSQTIKIPIQQEKFYSQPKSTQITQKKSIVVQIEKPGDSENVLIRSHILIYRKSKDSQQSLYVLSQRIQIQGMISILGFSYDEKLFSLTIGQGMMQIYAKSSESKYQWFQNITRCQKIVKGRLKFLDDGSRLILFCQRIQGKEAGFIIAYNLRNQTNHVYYQQNDSLSGIKLKKTVFSNDGRYILIANQKGPCEAYLFYGQCEPGFALSQAGYCRKCQQSEECFQSSFYFQKVIIICLVVILSSLALIAISVLVRNLLRFLQQKNILKSIEKNTQQLNQDQISVQMVGKSDETMQHIRQNMTLSKLQTTQCQFCKKQGVTHISSCLHFYHFACVNQIQREGISQCSKCHKHLSYNSIFQIKKDQIKDNR